MPEYIEREAVIALIEEKQKALCPGGRFSRNEIYGADRETFDNWQEIIDQLAAIPAADVEPVRHGRWIEGKHLDKCSVCGKKGFPNWNYCPNCGAKMDWIKEEG